MISDKPQVTLYTYGSVVPTNPGRGGIGIILLTEVSGQQHEREIGRYLGEPLTNNEAELWAAIEGLRALKKSCTVTLISSSQYVTHTMSRGWHRGANNHLWELLDAEVARHTVIWTWVKSRSGNELNDRARELAELSATIREDATDAA
jgi:ribonuclease HI